LRRLWLWDWLRGRRGRGRQVAAISIYGFVALVVIAAIASGGKKKQSPQSSGSASIASVPSTSTPSAPHPVRQRRAKAISRRRAKGKAIPKRRTTPACAAPADVLAGVYHPYRLHVLSPCRAVSGTVITVRHDEDGDVHIDVDTGGLLTNPVNGSEQGGDLVVEFMPRDGGHLPAPAVGARLILTGAWVLDADHGWNELHPVWSETLSAVTYRSGPQYGGSPADVGSSAAAADCTSNGAACHGYGGGTSAASGQPSASNAPPTSAPTPKPTPTPTPIPTGCSPKTSSGNCYEPGEYCSTADHGMTGVAGNGEPIICEDNNGWRWEPR